MSAYLNDPRLDSVTSREGRAARDYLIDWTGSRGWKLQCGGTVVPHIQFRRSANERPYPHSLILNPLTPTFYIRKPTKAELQNVPKVYDGAHANRRGEVKIPVPDKRTAERIATDFLT